MMLLRRKTTECMPRSAHRTHSQGPTTTILPLLLLSLLLLLLSCEYDHHSFIRATSKFFFPPVWRGYRCLRRRQRWQRLRVHMANKRDELLLL